MPSLNLFWIETGKATHWGLAIEEKESVECTTRTVWFPLKFDHRSTIVPSPIGNSNTSL
jgi:hypothetical protein